MSLSKSDRDKIPTKDFGVPDKKKYPLDTEAHIDSAAHLINHGDITSSEKKTLARKILRKANEKNMDTSGWNTVKKIAEQVPPMSDGTSIGNSPPRMMAPYYDEQEDELLQRVNSLDPNSKETMFDKAKRIVTMIHNKTEQDSQPPTGNQNCQLCTWCAEAQFRGMNVLPRPIYSPRDPALAIKGENIVLRPVRRSFTSQRDVVETVRGAVDSRWYVHVNWAESTGGHEFLVVNLNDYAYIMDAQAGLLHEIDETDTSHNYFRDINFRNSYMVRLDDKEFNRKLFNEMNDPSKVMPWKNSLDIPYMRDKGMLSPGDDDDPRFRRVPVPSEEGTKYMKQDPELSQYWEELNKATTGEFLVDRETGEQIGHVFVHTNAKDKGFIFNLEVNPKYRRQGYGWILTDDAVRRLGGEDLTVDADNTPAVNLYLQYGFTIYKKGQWHYDPPKDELWMKYDRSKLTQESTNVFESGHFAKYKDDVLGFNDEGMAVMKKCKCGGKVSAYLRGEPVYLCEKCGKYYGTLPCNIQEGVVRNIRDMTLIPVKDFKYDKVYYGDPTNGGSVRKLDDKPLFVTPHMGLASIFVGRRHIFHKLSELGYHEVNLGYDEWASTPDQPLTDVHVYVRNAPNLKPFTVEFDGYLHTIDCSQLKDNIYRYPWMSDTEHEILIAKVSEVKIDNVQKLHIRYHVRGIEEREPSSHVQEGAFQDIKNGVNPFSDNMVFHVTPEKHADGQIWKPRVPDYLDPYNPEDTGFEDNTTPRICFSSSIEGCLNGITVNLPRHNPDQFDKLYVYIPEKPWKEYKHKTNKELVKEKLVYDANVTREVWIMEPVRMKLYGVIRVDQVSNVKKKSAVPTTKGVKSDRNYFTYKWHWVVKPKVLQKGTKFDYSPENVIMDLCIDLKKFKYGLIRDGKLQTGNVSEADYDKYWVFHSGQEVDEAGGGNCWDMVEYEAGYLEAFGVPYKKYFMNFTTTKNKQLNTHTICVVPLNGKFIYIEQAFKRIIDEWGHERQKTFDKLNDIFDYVASVSAEYENQDVNFGVWDYTNTKIDYGTPSKEFMRTIMSGKMIYDGEATKEKPIKEGYVMSTRYYQEEEEKLSETEDLEDITIGDLELDDFDKKPSKEEDTEGDDGSSDDSFDDELPGYMKDRMSEDDLEEYEQPDENINADSVGLGSFGNDTSDVQNDYDPKETEILMKLMASEADAMNEYMDGAKETNVDVLRRLYADIANEERFHMEQLLYAKCELTGEKYQPKDPEVKDEYEELLKMGMDEETAMQTAVDRCHIRGSIGDDDKETCIEIQQDVETMEMALNMFSVNFDNIVMMMESKAFKKEELDHAIDVFVEACYVSEATYNTQSDTKDDTQTAKPRNDSNGPIALLKRAIGFLIRLLKAIIRKFVDFLRRIKNRARELRLFVKRYGIGALFATSKTAAKMYFVDLGAPNLIDPSTETLLALCIDLFNACAKALRLQTNLNVNMNIHRDPQYQIGNNIERGIQLLKGVQLMKTKMIIPKEEDKQLYVARCLFGYNPNKVDDGTSYNTSNRLKIYSDYWSATLNAVDKTLSDIGAVRNQQNSIYYKDKSKFNLVIKALETIIKTGKAVISAIQNDINEIMRLNNEALAASAQKTADLDKQVIDTNPVANSMNAQYQAAKKRAGIDENNKWLKK